MKKIKIKIFSIVLITFFSSNAVFGCSEIYFGCKDQMISARTLDFSFGDSLVVIFPRNIKKQSQVFSKNDKPLKWTSKYGSISFNLKIKQYNNPARSYFLICLDGINEKGLKVGAYYLKDTKYPDGKKSLPILSTASWVQYILDNFKTVKDVISASKKNKYRLSSFSGSNNSLKILNFSTTKFHLYIHDANGDSSIIEYINGKRDISFNPKIPILTNTIYKKAITLLKNYKGFGGTKEIPGGISSMDKFVRAAYNYTYFVKSIPKNKTNKSLIPVFPITDQTAVGYCFDLIQTVTQSPSLNPISDCTKWTALTDIKNKTVYFRTIVNPNISYLNLNELNFSSKQPIKTLKFYKDTKLNGNIKSKFKNRLSHK